MKKIYCMLLCVLMVAALAGCGQENIASVPTTTIMCYKCQGRGVLRPQEADIGNICYLYNIDE